MYQIPQEKIAYQIQLPQFVHNFKNNVVQMVVPHLLQVKKYLNEEENQQTLNPIITVCAVVFVVLVIKSVLSGLFGKREETVKGYEQAPQLTGQINDLKKQLKSMKGAFNDLVKDFTQKKTNTTASNQQILTKSTSTSTTQNNELCTQLLQLYTGSLDNNKRMANYVIQSLFQILSQLKRFKKIQRASLSSGRPSTSTIKSSERRLQSAISSKSPFKTINSIKKSQIKNSQRSIRSQITEKLQKKTQEGFLMPVEQTPKVQRVANHEVLVTKSSIPKVSEPAVEKKVQKVQNVLKNQEKQIPKIQLVKFPKVPTQASPAKLPKFQSQIQPPVQENKVETTRHIVHQQTQISETLNGQSSQKVTIQTTVSEVSQTIENMNGTTVIQTQQIQTEQTFEGQTNSQATQFIVPPKLPAIKKMVPPKPGVKRGPPPPPKKVV